MHSRSRGVQPELSIKDIAAALAVVKPVYTVEGFCDAHEITKPTYYELKKLGLGPREMEVGRRRLITIEAAAEWRRARERAGEERGL